MQNAEQPIRLPNGLLYPRVEVDHVGNEIGSDADRKLPKSKRLPENTQFNILESEYSQMDDIQHSGRI